MGRGPSEFFDYEYELTKSATIKRENASMSRRMNDFEDDEIDDLLGKYHFSAAASREIKKSLIHEPKKGNNKKVDNPDEIQDRFGVEDGVPSSEYNKGDEFLDDDGKDEDWRRARKAQQRAEAKKASEPEIESEQWGSSEVSKGFNFTGDFRKDKRGLREVLEKAAWGQRDRAAERLAELDLVKSESGLRYLANMLEEDWFE